ncbi:MAG: hypothetical protein ABH883_08465 [Candidatus Omnitrophota bacterium]
MKRKRDGIEPQRAQRGLMIGERKALCSQDKYPLRGLTKETNFCCIKVGLLINFNVLRLKEGIKRLFL